MQSLRCRRNGCSAVEGAAWLDIHALPGGAWLRIKKLDRGIAPLAANRRMPSLVALRRRMRAAGSAPKSILIAAGRQLLVILNAMIRSGQPIRL